MNVQSLKTRFLLITLLFFLVFITIAGIWLSIEISGMIRELGERYTVERVESARLSLARVLEREAALALNLAHSPVIIDWIQNEQDAEKRKRAFEELASYRESFADSNNFVAILSSGHYYNWSADGELVKSTLGRDASSDMWFYNTIEAGEPISFNLDYDVSVKVNRVWINCLVEHGGEPLGLAGTGLEITDMVSRLVSVEDGGTNVMLADTRGAVLAHRNTEIMARNARAQRLEDKTTIYDLVAEETEKEKARGMVEDAFLGKTVIKRLTMEGQSGLTAMAPIGNLDAIVVASVDTSEFLALRDFTPVFILLAGTIILGLFTMTVFLQRLVLRPLASLTESAQKIAEGEYELSIPVKGGDEISTLSSAFNDMAEKVRDYTQNLETMVKRRTAELSETNEKLTEANNRMTESIRYASLIQKGIMPDEEALAERFTHYSLFFRERDIVGGDFLYLRDVDASDPQAGFLIAAIDCEGHGVSGALMTMMTDSVLEHVIPDHDVHDPAAILASVEEEIKGTLGHGSKQDTFQSGFDIGLCACFPREDKLIFAGAGMPLYVRRPAGGVDTIAGRRKAIRNTHRRPPKGFENCEFSLRENSFFLITDGFIDQSDGKTGRSYGTRRLQEVLTKYDGTSTLWEEEFDEYRGEVSQRDDVLLVAFSFDRMNMEE